MTPPQRQEVVIEAEAGALPGLLGLPPVPAGIVLFAHGSGSSRHSPRNRFVAERLEAAGFGFLLFDLLTREEEQDRENLFDVGTLGRRVQAARRWVAGHAATRDLPVGLFGSATGAAAALVAAADDPSIGAVVCRGGRADLAGGALPRIQAATLLVVGGGDETVVTLNQGAHRALRCEKALEIVPGATHLFVEPGALESVAEHAVAWFRDHLGRRARREEARTRPERRR